MTPAKLAKAHRTSKTSRIQNYAQQHWIRDGTDRALSCMRYRVDDYSTTTDRAATLGILDLFNGWVHPTMERLLRAVRSPSSRGPTMSETGPTPSLARLSVIGSPEAFSSRLMGRHDASQAAATGVHATEAGAPSPSRTQKAPVSGPSALRFFDAWRAYSLPFTPPRPQYPNVKLHVAG